MIKVNWDGRSDIVEVTLKDKAKIKMRYATAKELISKLELALFDEDDTYEVMQNKLSGLRIENEKLKERIYLLEG